VEQSDVVIWLGDLNYRVELPKSSVQTAIKNNRLQEVRDCSLRTLHFFHLFMNASVIFRIDIP